VAIVSSRERRYCIIKAHAYEVAVIRDDFRRQHSDGALDAVLHVHLRAGQHHCCRGEEQEIERGIVIWLPKM
jgi:hypothetical protein